MKSEEIVIWSLAAIGLGSILWMISQQTGQTLVAGTQDETQVMGLGVQATMRLNAGTPLDISHHHHGWHPGYDPDPTGQPVTHSPHRYPALPGGNISTVIHQGWGSCVTNAPGGRNNWFLTPPEAAIV